MTMTLTRRMLDGSIAVDLWLGHATHPLLLTALRKVSSRNLELGLSSYGDAAQG